MNLTIHSDLTAERLRAIVRYCAVTGAFTWTIPPSNHLRLVGAAAGCDKRGYTIIKIDGRGYAAHRLAWLYVHGVWPKLHIDHRDGNTLNNALSNLREATFAQNNANARRRSGKDIPKGVRKNRSGYTARISHGGKQLTLGTFATVDLAARAYLEAATRIYGEFARAA
ncbi:MAG: HNH endonuclease [Erythrobacter sp.]|jgi:hypothetical protein